MFKKKATLAVVMATLIVLIVPLVVEAWTCADLPSACWNTTSRGCEGDVMWYSGCHMYCKTGVTTTPAIHCHLDYSTPVKNISAVD